ncbi:MAG: hypothetical protein DDT41_01315 [candidate division WS2 bacterium]|nr:hypothetical protein [Candidatus Psychracetigena formicireducens]
MINKTTKGFTLLEILLVITLVSIIIAIGAPVFQQAQTRNDLDVAVNITVQSLRRVQFLSQGVDGDTSWGLRIDVGEIIIFRGPSYAGRNPDFDEVFKISPTISFSGIQEFVFQKFTGKPQATGSVTFTSINNETRTISINEKGIIFY